MVAFLKNLEERDQGHVLRDSRVRQEFPAGRKMLGSYCLGNDEGSHPESDVLLTASA